MGSCSYRILGNERVAKQAVKKESIDTSIKLSKSEGKSIVWKEINKEWQQLWDQEVKSRHLHSIQSRVGQVGNREGNRKEEVATIRLRIRPCHLNRILNIIIKHPTSRCEQVREHVLIRCGIYMAERKNMMEGMKRSEITGAGLWWKKREGKENTTVMENLTI